jgi:hypothetical protein
MGQRDATHIRNAASTFRGTVHAPASPRSTAAHALAPLKRSRLKPQCVACRVRVHAVCRRRHSPMRSSGVELTRAGSAEGIDVDVAPNAPSSDVVPVRLDGTRVIARASEGHSSLGRVLGTRQLQKRGAHESKVRLAGTCTLLPRQTPAADGSSARGCSSSVPSVTSGSGWTAAATGEAGAGRFSRRSCPRGRVALKSAGRDAPVARR